MLWVTNRTFIIWNVYFSFDSFWYLRFKSSRSQMFFRRDIFKSFAIFTGKVAGLKHLFLQNTSSGCFWGLLFHTKFHTKSLVLLTIVLLIKKHLTLFCSLLKMKKLLCHMSVFVFIRYFIGAILLKKCCQKQGVRKREGWPYRGLSIEECSNLLYTISSENNKSLEAKKRRQL